MDKEETNEERCYCAIVFRTWNEVSLFLPHVLFSPLHKRRESRANKISVSCVSNIQSPSVSWLLNEKSFRRAFITSSLQKSVFMKDAIDLHLSDRSSTNLRSSEKSNDTRCDCRERKETEFHLFDSLFAASLPITWNGWRLSLPLITAITNYAENSRERKSKIIQRRCEMQWAVKIIVLHSSHHLFKQLRSAWIIIHPPFQVFSTYSTLAIILWIRTLVLFEPFSYSWHR